jgi:UDP-N-acetylmuramate dehydrogenase
MIDKFLTDNNIDFRKDECLKKYSSFQIGGKADYVVFPDSVEKLSALKKFLNEKDIKFFILGNGSNVIFSDMGFKGVIIKMSFLNKVEINQETVKAMAGMNLTKLCLIAAENGLSGLESCYGIPGSVGGGIFMNAGAYGGEISDYIQSVEYMDKSGAIKSFDKQNCKFSYRDSIFKNNKRIITGATFILKKGERRDILNNMQNILQKRKEKQPLGIPSAGSFFKRPEGSYASALIDRCGLKGLSVGGAKVSEKHAGFIVNAGNATCEDVKELAGKISRIVCEKTGVKLEKEVVFVE